MGRHGNAAFLRRLCRKRWNALPVEIEIGSVNRRHVIPRGLACSRPWGQPCYISPTLHIRSQWCDHTHSAYDQAWGNQEATSQASTNLHHMASPPCPWLCALARFCFPPLFSFHRPVYVKGWLKALVSRYPFIHYDVHEADKTTR